MARDIEFEQEVDGRWIAEIPSLPEAKVRDLEDDDEPLSTEYRIYLGFLAVWIAVWVVFAVMWVKSL